MHAGNARKRLACWDFTASVTMFSVQSIGMQRITSAHLTTNSSSSRNLQRRTHWSSVEKSAKCEKDKEDDRNIQIFE